MDYNFFEEAQKRIDIIESMGFSSVTSQLIGYLKFLESIPEVKNILDKLLNDKNVEKVLTNSSNQKPPELKTLEDVASACAIILNMVRQKSDATVLFSLGIRGSHGSDFSAIPHEFTRRYLRPFHAYLILALNKVDLQEELQYRSTTLSSPQFQEASFRVAGLWEWLNANQITKNIIEKSLSSSRAEEILAASNYNSPPQTESPDDILAVGLLLMQKCANGEEICRMEFTYGIRPRCPSQNLQGTADSVIGDFINPALYYIEEQLSTVASSSQEEVEQFFFDDQQQRIPTEIYDSLSRFRKDHPEPTAFIMMQFSDTPTHKAIVSAIKSTLKTAGITALRADDHQYHDDVLPNVKTYMHGCTFGIAVFERIENDVFNPNVSLEVGYMLAIGKNICYLKDKTLRRLPTDLISKLYREFNTHALEETLPAPLLKWLHEKGISPV